VGADTGCAPLAVTVAIPVRDGGALLRQTLAAVRSQRLDRPVELLVADSGSRDGSREAAVDHGAEVIDVAPAEFSHGGTRNLLASRAAGSHVAFLTQDAVPADELWLARLLEGFEIAGDVALAFGPYRPRPESSAPVRRELSDWFGAMSPDETPLLDRGVAPPMGLGRGRRGYFTDANGCVSKAAWERVPFRRAPYAEDHLLARDMLAAGYAKVFHPGAVVVHSHDYGPLSLFRRAFDEGRGMREVHGTVRSDGALGRLMGVQRRVRDDVRFVRGEGGGGAELVRAAAGSVVHHALRDAGDALGSHADHLAPAVRLACSLERRATFEPLGAGPAE
jgi:rhamnosyltransferase